MNLFNYDSHDSHNEEELKPILRIGDYIVGKFQKKNLDQEEIERTNKFLDELCDELPTKPPRKKRGITNHRQSILEEIRIIINEERKNSKEKKKYPPITGKALAMKLSHIKDIQDLYFMKSQGLDYRARSKGKKTFSQYIFGSIKAKK